MGLCSAVEVRIWSKIFLWLANEVHGREEVMFRRRYAS